MLFRSAESVKNSYSWMHNEKSAHTATWIVQCKDLFASKTAGFENSVRCDQPVYSVFNDYTHEDILAGNSSGGRVGWSAITLTFQVLGASLPLLIKGVGTNTVIKNPMQIMMLTQRDKPVVSHQIDLTGCNIVEFGAHSNYMMRVAFQKGAYSVNVFDETGIKIGCTSVEIDYVKSTQK